MVQERRSSDSVLEIVLGFGRFDLRIGLAAFDTPYVTTKDHGTGLGLSIVQRIVLEHGGEIVYEAGHGGACFTVMLPCSGPGVAPDSRNPAEL